MTVTIVRDLRGKFGDARNQGVRPTCLAFATSDLHAVSRAFTFVPLSAEYLFFHAVQRSAPVDPKKGVTLPAIASALKIEGQPIEADWPYLPSVPLDLSKLRPPKGLTVFRQTLSDRGDLVAEIIRTVDDGRPVLLCVKISQAFYSPDDVGAIAYNKNDRDTGYHAVLAVGHGNVGSKSMILVRNSWGKAWGLNGHAWLHSAYVSERLCSISTIP